MSVQFRGWGLNVPTVLVVILVAVLLASAITVVKPVVVPGASQGDSVQAAVSPCKPSYWRTKWVKNYHGWWGWGVTVRAQIKYNGCDVLVVPGTQTCSHWAVGYAISYRACTNYRTGTWTAYGQNVVVYSRYDVAPFVNGFPLSANVLMCQRYDRWGRLIVQLNGPYYSGC